MGVLICGDRFWTDYDSIKRFVASVKAKYPDTVIIQGECKGADLMAKQAAIELGLEHIDFPADWNKYDNKAGPIRNTQMLVEGKPDVVVAFHTDIKHSKGTKDMVSKAKKAGIRVILKGS